MLQMRANFPQRYTFLTVYRQIFCNFCAESPFFVKNTYNDAGLRHCRSPAIEWIFCECTIFLSV